MTDINTNRIASYLSNLSNAQKTQANGRQKTNDSIIIDNNGLMRMLQQVKDSQQSTDHQKKIEKISQDIQSGNFQVNLSQLSQHLLIEHMMKEESDAT
ncbi:hypothetical protein FOG18_13085 [Legionella israelensis]|uniref:flagellar biosynthesis anti-sigma factor FlgM n=1 Tax=Legionella israelensis TaxID=454 RepID=UPI001180BB61|nr:flagellar biosynthesis anti-sigma factor FlgM [Legionella israelensis]QDP73431.1 hypothetical protein FOG18_13085 [Legionella israelensis]